MYFEPGGLPPSSIVCKHDEYVPAMTLGAASIVATRVVPPCSPGQLAPTASGAFRITAPVSYVPPSALREILVSPAIEHVELKEPSVADQWALVHFMGEVIGEAETAR